MDRPSLNPSTPHPKSPVPGRASVNGPVRLLESGKRLSASMIKPFRMNSFRRDDKEKLNRQ